MFRRITNRRPVRLACWAAFGALFVACAADASPLDGPGYVVPADGEVFVTFDHQNAGATGALYFTGRESDGVMTSATSGPGSVLGRLLFNTRQSSTGTTLSLGLFNAGDTLHFLYTILKGSGAAKKGDAIRTDDESTSRNFAFSTVGSSGESHVTSLGIEDILDPARADWDYDDAEFTLTTTPRFVPAPGPVALGACGMALMLFGRKKRPC